MRTATLSVNSKGCGSVSSPQTLNRFRIADTESFQFVGKRTPYLCVFLFCCLLASGWDDTIHAQEPQTAEIEFFEREIRPLLVQHCFECHSPEKKIKGGLRLDTREGWVECVRKLIRWGFGFEAEPVFDPSGVRKAGELIKGFGGVASGPDPLIKLIEQIRELVRRRAGEKLSSRDIVDIQNMIGACVVAGNVRRTAEISFGEPEDESYLDLKNYTKNPERGEYGWTSNNSVFARVGMDYSNCSARTSINGEPGYGWLENMRAFGRMCEPANWKDKKAKGANPCNEQTLECKELCNLVEQFPHHHEGVEEFIETAKSAWLYAKIVTLATTHDAETNEIIARNRRIGQSMSGIAQFLESRGESELIRWSDTTYREICNHDQTLSSSWGIPESIKKTSVKPSGSVSLLAGATPGCHYPTMTCYIRRVRYATSHPDVPAIKTAGYKVEPAIVGYRDYENMADPIFDDGTVVAEFPVSFDDLPTEDDVTLRRKMEIAAMLQKWWADNQVSCTATFKPEEGHELPSLLSEFDTQLKGMSFLPAGNVGKYAQMPYEAISRERYAELSKDLKLIKWARGDGHAEDDRGCDGGACAVENFGNNA